MGNCCPCFDESHDGRSLNADAPNSTNNQWGQGHRLGGGEQTETDEQARRLERQRAADARRADWKQGGRTSSAATAPRSQNAPSRAAQTTTNEMVDVTTANTREIAAKAAEQRVKQSNQGLSEEAVEKMRITRQKDELIGKIRHYYNLAGRDEPFGLGGSSIEALKKQLEFAKKLNKK